MLATVGGRGRTDVAGRRREKTFTSLLAARATTPRQTRHHPQVHETVRALAEHDRRRTDSLATLARWAGSAV